jgi:hypothetical protein
MLKIKASLKGVGFHGVISSWLWGAPNSRGQAPATINDSSLSLSDPLLSAYTTLVLRPGNCTTLTGGRSSHKIRNQAQKNAYPNVSLWCSDYST